MTATATAGNETRTQGATVLYVTYDGILEPLGQSQVFQYLRELARSHRVHLLSYEKAADWNDVPKRERIAHELREAGISWTPLRYHKRPSALATAYDLAVGIGVGTFITLRRNVDLVHARSYVPSVIALAVKRLTGRKFLFDMRGFWADERVDGGIWPEGSGLFRTAKWFEKRFLESADAIVSLTEAGVEALPDLPFPKERLEGKRIAVIPTCANLQLFRPTPRSTPWSTPSPSPEQDERQQALRAERPFTLAYVGSVGTWYLFDPVLESFRQLLALEPNARLLIVNRGEHAFIRERIAALGLPPEKIELRELAHRDVASRLSQVDAGVFFIKQTFSKKASAPTKLGELLGCGVPVLVNAGVGDMDRIVSQNRVGVVVPETSSPAALREAVLQLVELARDPRTRDRCVQTAQRHFSLESGVRAYDALWRELRRARAARDAA